MDSVLYLSEIVAELGDGDARQEVCATANASYDRDQGLTIIELDCLTRPSGIDGTSIPADWLPKHQTLKERVPPDEASDLTREVFGSWVKKVRAAIPRKLVSLESRF